MNPKILVVTSNLGIGGIEKSLVTFLNYIKDYADIDLLLWNKTERELLLPTGIKRINVPTVKSVRGSLRNDGIFSRAFWLSLLACKMEKRWKIMPKLKKKYDIAIAYSHVGSVKYYVIDKVSAKKKYAFYHHGVYEVDEPYKSWNSEYYPKYDILFTVSDYVKGILEKEQMNVPIEVIKNLIDIDEIRFLSEEDCPEMDCFEGVKIVTVGRLSEEKNMEGIIPICLELKKRNVSFRWFIVGDGDLRGTLRQSIVDSGLENVCFLCGMQMNPYKYMGRCNVYVQLSKYEAEGITIKEAAVLNKQMVLSNIPIFVEFSRQFHNIAICDGSSIEIAEQILKSSEKKGQVNKGIEHINDVAQMQIDKILV